MGPAESAIISAVQIVIANTEADAAGTLMTFVLNVVTVDARMGRVFACPTWLGILPLALHPPLEDPIQGGVRQRIASGTLQPLVLQEAEVQMTNFEEGLWTQGNGKKSKFAWIVIGICLRRAEL